MQLPKFLRWVLVRVIDARAEPGVLEFASTHGVLTKQERDQAAAFLFLREKLAHGLPEPFQVMSWQVKAAPHLIVLQVVGEAVPIEGLDIRRRDGTPVLVGPPCEYRTPREFLRNEDAAYVLIERRINPDERAWMLEQFDKLYGIVDDAGMRVVNLPGEVARG